MDTAAIIVASERGSKLLAQTTDRPQSKIELAGRPLLSWQLDSLAFVENICVITGYKSDVLYGDFIRIWNPRWEYDNMLSSLLRGREFADSFFARDGRRLLVMHSNCIYSRDHIDKLLYTNGDIVAAYDTAWQDLWQLRFESELEEGNPIQEQDGFLKAIGEPSRSEDAIQGQFMGLLSLSSRGWIKWREQSAILGNELANLDMVTFLRLLIASNTPVKAMPVVGKWCASESGHDVEAYQKALERGDWKHDWRY